MTTATACRACGAELREGARFCDGCGSPDRTAYRPRVLTIGERRF
jgi:RNA polymerase subunit RPABC4/transcription elongation factor Spt4